MLLEVSTNRGQHQFVTANRSNMLLLKCVGLRESDQTRLTGQAERLVKADANQILTSN
jgi:hypothetical protein